MCEINRMRMRSYLLYHRQRIGSIGEFFEFIILANACWTIAAWRTQSPRRLAHDEGWQPLGAVLHSSDELSELLQWLCRDEGLDSSINAVYIDKLQYNAVLSYTPYVAYSQTIRRRGKNIYVAKE